MMKLPLRGEPISVPFTGRRLLERAMVVVRFTPVLKIAEESGNGIAEFQESIRSEYPLAELEREAVMRIEMKPDGSVGAQQEAQPVWRLSDIKQAWRVSLTPRSIALETTGDTYKDWPDFAQRISSLVDAVGTHFAPSHRQYVGVRYINAAVVNDGADPRLECAKELVSITGNPDLELADLLWRFSVDEGHMLLRSGVMPSGASYDPSVFMPRDNPTWYLDIDITNSDSDEFDAVKINASILAQVKRLHAIYLWAMQVKDN
ncbi:TIGR04255 family protein [Sphingorhabdus sp. IMCC26285]|uniref:TIGR04255 family protein n=1 Tax=Sphingorhabdus profundilacus TaxID=2509718 RepID=A0A6I4M1K1_9SPHN|nr:TIGR04255 family protein [Sphingorhabdus profundilacus]MVZ96328.1 TIGR04255 family protein [Sphingorhabdus profundilacus]